MGMWESDGAVKDLGGVVGGSGVETRVGCWQAWVGWWYSLES